MEWPGPELLAALPSPDGCPTGQAKITPGFDLPATWVIHTVGPIWYGGTDGEPELLASCYRQSLALADEVDASSSCVPGHLDRRLRVSDGARSPGRRRDHHLDRHIGHAGSPRLLQPADVGCLSEHPRPPGEISQRHRAPTISVRHPSLRRLDRTRLPTLRT
ncbi:MAG: macro domain-containing protein [Acidimicrobiales bacterium]